MIFYHDGISRLYLFYTLNMLSSAEKNKIKILCLFYPAPHLMFFLIFLNRRKCALINIGWYEMISLREHFHPGVYRTSRTSPPG